VREIKGERKGLVLACKQEKVQGKRIIEIKSLS
jgi:hypothetical protein